MPRRARCANCYVCHPDTCPMVQAAETADDDLPVNQGDSPQTDKEQDAAAPPGNKEADS